MAALPSAIRRDHTVQVPRFGAAAAAGFVAGTATLLLMQWISVVAYDEPAAKLPRMMAAVIQGPRVLGDEIAMAPVAAGFAVHYVLSFLYALALGAALSTMRREHAPAVGLAFGCALYLANLHGFASLFPWFAELRTPDTLVAHAIFGVVAAGAYCDFSRERRAET